MPTWSWEHLLINIYNRLRMLEWRRMTKPPHLFFRVCGCVGSLQNRCAAAPLLGKGGGVGARESAFVSTTLVKPASEFSLDSDVGVTNSRPGWLSRNVTPPLNAAGQTLMVLDAPSLLSSVLPAPPLQTPKTRPHTRDPDGGRWVFGSLGFVEACCTFHKYHLDLHTVTSKMETKLMTKHVN